MHQLRQFLQTTPLANEAVLRHLLLHHLQKTAKSAIDRDKTDFLLVQYFSLCAPSGLEDADVDLDYVAQVLEPVLGPQPSELPSWLSSLETITQSAARCRRLSELLHSGVLEQGRKLKTQNAARYFEPAAMVAFARFSFMIRRIFFRLMQDDLNAIQDGLRELERHGVSNIDCRRAQFSAEEPIGRLRMICQSWKVMFHAEYSSGQPLAHAGRSPGGRRRRTPERGAQASARQRRRCFRKFRRWNARVISRCRDGACPVSGGEASRVPTGDSPRRKCRKDQRRLYSLLKLDFVFGWRSGSPLR